MSHRIAVISDTHNLLRDEVIEKIKSCDVVLHGGDISNQKVLDTLEKLAQVYVVRGNNDKEWAEHIPATLSFELYGKQFFMVHKKKEIPEDVAADVVIYGHSHKYDEKTVNNTLYLNPGSCGPRRLNQAITMAVIIISNQDIAVERVDIAHSEQPINDGINQITVETVRVVGTMVAKDKPVTTIAKKLGLELHLAEQIVRMYVTHPGVTPEQVMTKLGL